MYPLTENAKEEVSCGEEEEDDEGFNEDMEALRRACMLNGRDPYDIDKDDHDIDEDLELLRKIKSQFSDSWTCEPLSLSTLPPATVSDDYETLHCLRERWQIDPCCKSVEQTCNEEISTTDADEGQPSTSENFSLFPKSAVAFLDAINRNRACQKFLRSKLTQIQEKIEENNKLKQRVKILRDFQLHCKRRTGEALSQKKDPRVQLILTKRPRRASRDLIKPPHDDDGAMFYGPAEVANYRMTTLTKFLDQKNWSEVEKKELEKGIRQQFQEMVLLQCHEGVSNDDIDDNILASIKDVEITPYNIREFLPKVNWQRLASIYVPSRSGEECEARWLNWEDPLINHEPWTVDEDKNILELVQTNGVNDWIDIAAASLVHKGTKRTPFQCLARYQRSLNASILKHEWTKEDDAKLGSAVDAFGEGDWQSVASVLEGRTGTQCSNRWKKSLHPTRTRKGKWNLEEDTRLTVAQILFRGSKNWNKIAQFVPGRTQAQCRDRFVNSLEPSLKFGEWTEEEDSVLRAAIEEHGHCWSKVSACVPRRTDNMCWRRWKVLFPQEVLLLKQEKRIRKAALICNFVDREEERPALGPNDFLLPDDTSTKTLTYPGKMGNIRRGRGSQSVKKKNVSSNCQVPKRHKNYGQVCNNSDEVEICNEDDDASNWDDTIASFLHTVKKRKLQVQARLPLFEN